MKVITPGGHRPQVTFYQARKLLRCDAAAGKLYWKRRPVFMFTDGGAYEVWNNRFAGKEAFIHEDENGYMCGGILNKRYRAHRVIWLLHYKTWPIGDVRHRNDIWSDNRISNLFDTKAGHIFPTNRLLYQQQRSIP